MSKLELLARIVAIEARLDERAEAPLEGQQAIIVPTIGHHTYLGPGPCRDELFGTICGAHRDAHHLIDEDDPR